MRRLAGILAIVLPLTACEQPQAPVIQSLPALPPNSAGRAAERISGPVGGPTAGALLPEVSFGTTQPVSLPAGVAEGGRGGDISLDFADTDIREVAAQILGNLLQLNYTIDPGVRGTATLHTTRPVSRSQLLPVLQSLLAQNNASLEQTGGLYRVVANGATASQALPGRAGVPAGVASGGAGLAPTTLAGSDAVSGSVVLPLRYASAVDLAKVLQPFAQNGARVIADPGRNVLLIGGDPSARAALVSLAGAFDVDLLAGQSYALFPVTSGDVKDFGTALQDAFRSQEALAGVVRVVPLPRFNAVLVTANQARYIEDARRLYAVVERSRRQTVRTWHVYYLQNSHANDAAYVLQQAFTPGNVTAQPSAPRQAAPGVNQATAGSGGVNGSIGGSRLGGLAGPAGANGPGLNGGVGAGGAPGGLLGAAASGNPQAAPPNLPGSATPDATAISSANPLFGGLDPTAGGGTDLNAMRIIPNPQNNALLIYATPRENDTVEAMLRKTDILPLQVRIDATIAEVTLNDQLQYGTQFFFKSGGINGILNNAVGAVGDPVATVLATSFPGFVLGGRGQGGAPFAISALQAVTTVHVLSSPEIMVLDNQPARLQVGNLVPYLTTSSQSAIGSGSPIINSIAYQPTGVIMEVTPRVNSGGLVTLDIAQEVSDVDTATPKASGIDSPTFLERNVTSRVVVQDGQTVGLAGLIRDNVSRGNQGIPWLKDIPVLGLLAGTQSNQRTRTELLVLVTPHVVHDQRDARALTEDLRDQLINAAAVPDEMRTLRPSGSNDPDQRLRRQLRLQR